MVEYTRQQAAELKRRQPQIERLRLKQEVAVQLIRQNNGGEYTAQERRVWDEYQKQIEALEAV